MGTMVVFDSADLLLQREDQPAALEALRAHLEECPGDLNGDPGSPDLVSLLRSGAWVTDVDEHGDIVGLRYGGDQYPRDATDDFPMSILEALAPFVRHGRCFRWIEGDAGVSEHHVGRGRNVYYRRAPGARLTQLGDEPVLRPGTPVDVRFRLDGYGTGDGAVVELGCPHSTQVSGVFDPPSLAVGETGTVRLTLYGAAAEPVAYRVSMTLDGTDLFDTALRVRVAPAPEHDVAHEVVATESPLDNGFPSTVVEAGDLPFLLEVLRRYARRHADRPGAAFLRDVLAAPDLPGALRAAHLEAGFGAGGEVLGFRFTGTRLPGRERYLMGLFASMRGVVRSDPAFKVAYAHDPGHWVVIGYDWGEPSRHVWDR
jgi:hypothetical protein